MLKSHNYAEVESCHGPDQIQKHRYFFLIYWLENYSYFAFESDIEVK
jgi:hypothetical protein